MSGPSYTALPNRPKIGSASVFARPGQGGLAFASAGTSRGDDDIVEEETLVDVPHPPDASNPAKQKGVSRESRGDARPAQRRKARPAEEHPDRWQAAINVSVLSDYVSERVRNRLRGYAHRVARRYSDDAVRGFLKSPAFHRALEQYLDEAPGAYDHRGFDPASVSNSIASSSSGRERRSRRKRRRPRGPLDRVAAALAQQGRTGFKVFKNP